MFHSPKLSKRFCLSTSKKPLRISNFYAVDVLGLDEPPLAVQGVKGHSGIDLRDAQTIPAEFRVVSHGIAGFIAIVKAERILLACRSLTHFKSGEELHLSSRSRRDSFKRFGA